MLQRFNSASHSYNWSLNLLLLFIYFINKIPFPYQLGYDLSISYFLSYCIVTLATRNECGVAAIITKWKECLWNRYAIAKKADNFGFTSDCCQCETVKCLNQSHCLRPTAFRLSIWILITWRNVRKWKKYSAFWRYCVRAKKVSIQSWRNARNNDYVHWIRPIKCFVSNIRLCQISIRKVHKCREKLKLVEFIAWGREVTRSNETNYLQEFVNDVRHQYDSVVAEVDLDPLLPPIRRMKERETTNSKATNGKTSRIKSCDYDQWNKYDPGTNANAYLMHPNKVIWHNCGLQRRYRMFENRFAWGIGSRKIVDAKRETREEDRWTHTRRARHFVSEIEWPREKFAGGEVRIHDSTFHVPEWTICCTSTDIGSKAMNTFEATNTNRPFANIRKASNSQQLLLHSIIALLRVSLTDKVL